MKKRYKSKNKKKFLNKNKKEQNKIKKKRIEEKFSAGTSEYDNNSFKTSPSYFLDISDYTVHSLREERENNFIKILKKIIFLVVSVFLILSFCVIFGIFIYEMANTGTKILGEWDSRIKKYLNLNLLFFKNSFILMNHFVFLFFFDN